MKAGDLLVELDPTEEQADLASLRYDRSQAALDVAIATFLVAGDPAGAFDAPADIERGLVARNKAQAAEELRKHQADLAAIDADMAEKRAGLVSNGAQIERAKALLPLLDDRYETTKGLFAGSLRGAERCAVMLTLIATAKLNDVDPQAWLADVLGRIHDTPQSRLAELLPWTWNTARTEEKAAA